MLLRRLITLCVCTALAGCTYRDPSVDLMESELRWMEDQVYSLEDELQVAHNQLAQYQGCDVAPTPATPMMGRPSPLKSDYTVIEPDEAGSQVPPRRSESLPGFGRSSATPDNKSLQPPRAMPEYSIVPEQKNVEPEYQIVEPSVELPPETASPPPAELPRTLPAPNQRPILDQPSGGADSTDLSPGNVQLQSFYWEERAEPDAQPSSDEALDADVTHIVAEATITDGYDFENEPCPPGLLVVVQPRNASGEYVALPGALSLVVLDGTKSGAKARVARWDVDAAEARRKLRDSNYGSGIHLNLEWPDLPPESSELVLFVRYTTVEGRKLECDRLLATGSTPEWTTAAKRLTPRKAEVATPSSVATHPIPGGTKIDLRPIPKDKPFKTVSLSGTNYDRTSHPQTSQEHSATGPPSAAAAAEKATSEDLPTLRKSTRPHWRPNR